MKLFDILQVEMEDMVDEPEQSAEDAANKDDDEEDDDLVRHDLGAGSR